MDFELVVVGTGLPQSIAAAALAKAGYKIAHVDANPYYGADHASLSQDELLAWAHSRHEPSASSGYLAAQHARFAAIAHHGPLLPLSRQYALSLAPSLIPALGPHIDALVASGVARYGSFRLLDRLALYDPAAHRLRSVPRSKEDVFKSKDLSLLQKRRLMRFFLFAVADADFEGRKELEGRGAMPFPAFLRDAFALDPQSVDAIVYALAFCVSPQDPTLPALQRIRRYMRSIGRYGPSPFLIAQYGGLGEIAQGFCRSSAVSGSTYILGHDLRSYTVPEHAGEKVIVELDGFEEPLRCDVLIAAADYLSPDMRLHNPPAVNAEEKRYAVARCVAIVDKKPYFPSERIAEPQASEGTDIPEGEKTEGGPQAVDTALMVFPPRSLAAAPCDTAVHVFVTGEGSMSAPKNRWVVYINMPLDIDSGPVEHSAEELLRPYLDAALTLTALPSDPDSSADTDTRADTTSEANTYAPLFTLFYIEHPSVPVPASAPTSTTPAARVVCVPAERTGHSIPERADEACVLAEDVFRRAREVLRGLGVHGREEEEEGEGEMWPPLEVLDEEAEEW